MKSKTRGFTLLESLLVTAIAASLLVAYLTYTTNRVAQARRDKTAIIMEQILSAGMAYYAQYGTWPTSIGALQGASYLRGGNIVSGWGGAYTITSSSTANFFTVSTTLPTLTEASVVAGMVPLGSNSVPLPAATAYNSCKYAAGNGFCAGPTPPCGQSCAPTYNCPGLGQGGLNLATPNGTCVPPGSMLSTTVTGATTLPAQNINNARAMNYAGVYANGGCVPAPVCLPGMSPMIYTLPGSAAAVTSTTGCSGDSPSSCTAVQTTAMYSFATYAVGTSTSDNSPVDPYNPGPLDCKNQAALQCDFGITPTDPTGVLYWRVCLSISNSQGVIVPTNDTQGQAMGSIVAYTRCAAGGEASGSPANIWTAP